MIYETNPNKKHVFRNKLVPLNCSLRSLIDKPKLKSLHSNLIWVNLWLR